MLDQPNSDHHPSWNDAQIACCKAVDILSKNSRMRDGQIAWLLQQRPIAIDVHGCVLFSYPSQREARIAHANTAMVCLDHALRDGGLAAGIQIAVAAPEPRTGSDSEPAKRCSAVPDGIPPWERKPVYMPAFLVATTLPHSDPKASEFTRVNGKVTTTLHAPRRIGLPYGVYARLILIDLATAAVRTRTRRFRVGRSMREFLARMRIGDGGGKRGEGARAREQMDRLCATTFTTTHLSKYGGHNLLLADSWMERSAGGREVALAERFFLQATKSAVPLDPVVLRAVRRSPLSIDIYGWITYRMATLDRPTSISWGSLEKQFGAGYERPRDFRRKFRRCLDRVKDAWPGHLGVDAEDRRILLNPGPPSVAIRSDRRNAKFL